MGCGKQQRLDAEINPDTPVSDVQFPLKETEEELHFLNHKFTSWLMFFKLRSSYSVMRHIEINCCKYNAWLHHAAHRNVRIQWR